MLIYQLICFIQQMQYDFVCMNDQCIRNERSFFKFNIESVHIKDRHKVKPIHPLSFSHFFKKQDRPGQQFNVQPVYAQLMKTYNQAIQKLYDQIKSLFSCNSLIPKVEETLAIIENLDMNKLCAQMSEGNNQTLKYLNEFQKQRVQNNFKTFLMKKIKMMQYQQKDRLNELRVTLQNQFGKLKYVFFPKNIVKPQVVNQKDFLYENEQIKPAKQNYVKEQFFENEYRNIKQEHFEQYESSQKEEDCAQQEEQSQQKSQKKQTTQHIVKTKLIKKSSRKRKKKSLVEDQIQVISEKTIIIRQSKSANRTLNYLYSKYPQLLVLHIFDEKIATKTAVKNILNNFTHIKKISFNCFFQFQPSILHQVYAEVLQRVKIQLKWDMSRFFTDYYAYRYFPQKILGRRQRKKVIDVEEMSYYLPRNHSLWIGNRQQNKKMNLLSINPDYITVLQFRNSSQKDVMSIQLPVHFKNISVLVLKKVNVTTQDFIRFISLNKNLHTLVVDLNNYWFNMENALQQMKKLHFLVKLSVSHQHQASLQKIFQFRNLTHLNLDNCFYNEWNQQRKQVQFKNFSKMTKLVHLGLYQNQIIYSPILRLLSPQSFKTLKYLNLGRTKVDNEACKYLQKMVSLKYLNVDYTQIHGNNFTYFCVVIGKYENSLDSEQQLNETNLTTIAKSLPTLTYLNISFNKNVKTYNFEGYKKLKTLGVDKDLYDILLDIVSPQINLFKIKQRYQ